MCDKLILRDRGKKRGQEGRCDLNLINWKFKSLSCNVLIYAESVYDVLPELSDYFI